MYQSCDLETLVGPTFWYITCKWNNLIWDDIESWILDLNNFCCSKLNSNYWIVLNYCYSLKLSPKQVFGKRVDLSLCHYHCHYWFFLKIWLSFVSSIFFSWKFDFFFKLAIWLKKSRVLLSFKKQLYKKGKKKNVKIIRFVVS